MPRAKTQAAADVQPETGFAALEAKVEDMHVEAAIEAELSAEDAAAAAAPLALEQISAAAEPAAPEPRTWADPSSAGTAQAPPAADAPAAGPAGAVASVFGAFQEIGQATLRFQTETFASFTSVRSPQDLLAAQVALGQRAMGLYSQNLARLTQAVPDMASFAPR